MDNKDELSGKEVLFSDADKNGETPEDTLSSDERGALSCEKKENKFLRRKRDDKPVLTPQQKKERFVRRAILSLKLFLCYLKIGLFTFGGGYAMIALLEREYVQKRKWISDAEFYEILAISESTPGPIAINSATFIGFKLIGVWGAFVAVVAVCIPSFSIILLISYFYDAFMAFIPVQYAFEGIKVGIAILITSAGVNMMKKAQKGAFEYFVFVPAFLLVTCFDIFNIDFSSVYLILIGICVGILYKLILDAINKRKSVVAVGLDTNASESESEKEEK